MLLKYLDYIVFSIFLFFSHVHAINEDAIKFYETFGFAIVERLIDYYKRLEMPDAFVLEKVLSSTQLPVWTEMTYAPQGPRIPVYQFIIQCALSVETWSVVKMWLFLILYLVNRQ